LVSVSNQLNRSAAAAAPIGPPSSSAEDSLSPGSPAAADNRDADRRREARYPAQEPAEFEVMFTGAEPLFGTVLDVSRSGLRIALPRPITRGEQVKIKLNQNVIFGEVRYCRPVTSLFHIGIRIHDLVRPEGRQDEHLADDALSLYAVGKGLSVSEVIEVRQHLSRCEACRVRVAEREPLLNPSLKARPRRPLCSEPRA
jgi:PilZ domain